MLSRNLTAGGLAALLLAAVCHAEDAPQARTFGWRGNWTGLYTDAHPPMEWARTPRGILNGATCHATRKTLYRQETGFDELHSYNHIGVAASPTLIGKNIAVMDNQGACLVFEPGPVFKQVAMNRIETMLPRDWPVPPQETIANGPPVVDENRIYIRGEQYLYCIGAK